MLFQVAGSNAPLLAVIYDDLVRNHWEDRSSKLVRFKIDPSQQDETILKRATALYNKIKAGNTEQRGAVELVLRAFD